MKYLLIGAVVLITCFGCQKHEFIDTGKASAPTDKTIWEYLQTNSYNWDSTRLVIERAGLVEMFDGTDPDYEDITFLGCTNLSILRYMLVEVKEWDRSSWPWVQVVTKPAYMQISDIPVEDCRKLILRHVIKGKYMKADIPDGIPAPKSGGKDFDTMEENKLWMCKYAEPYAGVSGMGPVHLYLQSYTAAIEIDVASADIECSNGVVHALHYSHKADEI